MKLKTFFFSLGLGLLSLAPVHAEDWVWVANKDLSYAAVPKNDLKDILLGYKTKWANGQIIKIALRQSGDMHGALILAYTAKSAEQFDKYWKKQVFTGNGIMPDQFKSESEVLDYVAQTSGAIGYVSPGADMSKVKVLKTQ